MAELTPERLAELREEYTGYDLRLRSSRVGGTMRVGELLTLISAAEERDRLRAENERLSKLVYVPGLWRCARCKFSLLQRNLNAADGTVTARDEAGDKCPNCDAPLWRVTERDAGNEMIDRAEVAFEEKRTLAAENEAVVTALLLTTRRLERFLMTWRPPVNGRPGMRVCEDCGAAEGEAHPFSCVLGMATTALASAPNLSNPLIGIKGSDDADVNR